MTDQAVITGNEITLSCLRGSAHGLALAAEELRKQSGREFAEGKDDRARLLRSAAEMIEAKARQAARESLTYATDYGLTTD